MNIVDEMHTRAHAVFSASSAERWTHCPGSIKLSEGCENKSSAEADEGTRAHAYAAYLLQKKMGLHPDKVEPDNLEMADCCEDYAKYCHVIPGKHFIEARVNYESIAPGGFGTADFLSFDEVRGLLYVIDFKYGKGVSVLADHNKQLMLYALGALETYPDLAKSIDQIELTIFQPRLQIFSVWEISRKDLEEIKDYFIATVQLALSDLPNCNCGDWCRFCPAKGKCREYAKEFDEILKTFEKGTLPPDLTDEEITKVLRLKSKIVEWLQAVDNFALDCAVRGHDFKGFRLKSRYIRAYTDEHAVADALTKAGIDPFTQKIKPLTAIEREVGKKKTSEILNGLIHTVEGKQSLVAIK